MTFAEAADEWLRYDEHDRGRKPSTIAGYRALLKSQLLPTFGEMPIESITTPEIEAWIGGIDVFSVEEVMALVRAAASGQDAAICLTAAFTGLRRGELLALRWRDVDFEGQVIRVRASYADGALTTPKSGKVRSVPMAPDVAETLAKLGQRENWIGDDDLVFVGQAGSYLDGRALRRRYDAALKRANLRKLRFHDLRHTFGTRMIAKADIRRVQEWMGSIPIIVTVKTNYYVDAFNLYYGALKGTPHKWLDLAALFGRVFPKNETHRIRYFTARVDRRPPHFQQHQQQQAYQRARYPRGSSTPTSRRNAVSICSRPSSNSCAKDPLRQANSRRCFATIPARFASRSPGEAPLNR